MVDNSKRVSVSFSDGLHGGLTVRANNGFPEIEIRDKRGLNTKTAGIVLTPEETRDLGNLLVQLGYGTSLTDADAGSTFTSQRYSILEE